MMRKRFLIILLMIAVALTMTANAQQKKVMTDKKTVAKKAVKQTPAPVKKTPAVVKPSKAAPEVAAPEAAPVAEGNISDLKDDMNKALAELKGQMDKVKADNSDAKVGGAIFFQWSKYTQNGTATTPNAFDVTRAYLDFKKKLDWGANVRVTLDVARLATATTVTKGAAGETVTANASTQQLFDYLKYAYAEMPLNISALQLVPWELTAKVGLQHTVWIDWADKILNLRYIAKSLLDNEGVMSSADFGVGGWGKVSLPGLSDIEYQATALNGTGYKATESDSKKAVGLRVNTTAYDAGDNGKVIVGAMANVEGLNTSFDPSTSNKQAALELAYKHDLGAANYEYVTGSKSSKKIVGSSLGGIFNIGSAFNFLPNLNVFARVDNYDPDTTLANNEIARTFYGVTYDWGKDIKLALDQQTMQTGSGATTAILYLHTSVTF
ncbi:MAG: hypothetical protein PHG97_05520 [Candidatus Margulisbacteria bacterium]|nr:hypothetical protein [Candidatus Margulisiibacteriota bacterium]